MAVAERSVVASVQEEAFDEAARRYALVLARVFRCFQHSAAPYYDAEAPVSKRRHLFPSVKAPCYRVVMVWVLFVHHLRLLRLLIPRSQDKLGKS